MQKPESLCQSNCSGTKKAPPGAPENEQKWLVIDYQKLNQQLPFVQKADSNAKGVISLIPLPKIDDLSTSLENLKELRYSPQLTFNRAIIILLWQKTLSAKQPLQCLLESGNLLSVPLVLTKHQPILWPSSTRF